jgi:hypothetical protein
MSRSGTASRGVAFSQELDGCPMCGRARGRLGLLERQCFDEDCRQSQVCDTCSPDARVTRIVSFCEVPELIICLQAALKPLQQ